jgi:hypothetical protein
MSQKPRKMGGVGKGEGGSGKREILKYVQLPLKKQDD